MQLAGCRIDGEGAHIRCVIEIRSQRERVFCGYVKESLVRMHRKERGINDLRREFGFAHFPGCGLKAADIDALTVASSRRQAFLHIGEAGVGAEVHEVLGRWGGRTPGTWNTNQSQKREQNKMADIFHGLFFLTPPPGDSSKEKEILLMRRDDGMS